MTTMLLGALCGSSVEAWIRMRGPEISPDTLYWLRLTGLSDVFHSGGFISGLLILVLNLFFSILDRLPEAWRQANQRSPGSLHLDEMLRFQDRENYFIAEFETRISRESFKEAMMGWTDKRIGKPKALRSAAAKRGEVPDELQIVAQHGRWSRISILVAHLGLMIGLVGVALSSYSSFEAKLRVEEGSRTSFLEMQSGRPPNGWKPQVVAGQVAPGFFVPQFEVACSRFDFVRYLGTRNPKFYQSVLDFYEGGKLVSTETVSVGSPGKFRDWTIHQSGYLSGATLSVNLTITDRQLGKDTSMPRLNKGGGLKLDGFRFELVEIQPESEINGPAAQIEYQEVGKTAERFWIFANYRDYDFAHRPGSRHYFTLDSVNERQISEIKVSRDPGALWVWVGGGLFVVMTLFSLLSTYNRYWLIWNTEQVTVVGWSSKPFLFEPRFERILEQFKRRLQRLDPGVGQIAIEVSRGGA